MALNKQQMIQYGRILASHDKQLAEAKQLFLEGKVDLDELVQITVAISCHILIQREAVLGKDFNPAAVVQVDNDDL